MAVVVVPEPIIATTNSIVDPPPKQKCTFLSRFIGVGTTTCFLRFVPSHPIDELFFGFDAICILAESALKSFLSGGVGGICVVLVGHPFDLVKVCGY
jgi:hypothetical protein